MRKFKLTIAALAVACFGFVDTLLSQSYFDKLKEGQTANHYLSAIDLSPALICKYIGSNSLGGTIAVDAATGDITFSVGAVGSSTVSTTFECPVSGALGGVIDVSDAACNTIGEVLDIVNTSTSDFACVPVAALRSDTTVDRLQTLSETAANAAEGLPLFSDEDVSPFTMTYIVAPNALRSDIREYRPPQGRAGLFVANPFRGYRTDFWKSIAQTTYSSGTSTASIIAVTMDLNAKAETVETLWSQTAGATATDQTIDFTAVGGLAGRNDAKILFRFTNSAVLSAGAGSVVGVRYKY